MNEIWSAALLDIQLQLLCVCGVDSFIPELEHLIKIFFHDLFAKKKPLQSRSWKIVHEMKLRSTSPPEQNFPNDITWITWNMKQNLEIWLSLKSDLELFLWGSGRKLILLQALCRQASPPITSRMHKSALRFSFLGWGLFLLSRGRQIYFPRHRCLYLPDVPTHPPPSRTTLLVVERGFIRIDRLWSVVSAESIRVFGVVQGLMLFWFVLRQYLNCASCRFCVICRVCGSIQGVTCRCRLTLLLCFHTCTEISEGRGRRETEGGRETAERAASETAARPPTKWGHRGVWVNSISVYLTFSFVHSSPHSVVVHDGLCMLLPYVQCMWYDVVLVYVVWCCFDLCLGDI